MIENNVLRVQYEKETKKKPIDLVEFDEAEIRPTWEYLEWLELKVMTHKERDKRITELEDEITKKDNEIMELQNYC